jgi:hypothetical protein
LAAAQWVGKAMSDIDHAKTSTQSASAAVPIEKLVGGVEAVRPGAKNDLRDGRSGAPRSTVSAFIAKPALSACRPPLFRR